MTLILVLNQPAAAGTITETGETSSSVSSTDVLTFAHEVTQTAQYLLVVTRIQQTTTCGVVSTVTYNGDALTEIISAKHPMLPEVQLGLWGLVNPDVGNYNVIVTADRSEAFIHATAMDWEGVWQSNPTRAGVKHEPAGQTDTTTVTVTSTTGELVIAASTCFQAAMVTGLGQTQLFNLAIGYFDATYAASTKDGAASVTMTDTNVSINEYPIMVAVALKPIQDDVLYVIMI